MATFTLQLQDAASTREVPGVVSFIAQDATGHFGIKANHDRMVTTLVFGLARYRTEDERWHYVILPGGVLYFVDNRLQVATRRFFEDDDLDRIVGQWEARLREEEEELEALKQSLQQLEQEILRRMYRTALASMGEP